MSRAPHGWWLVFAALLGALLWIALIWQAADVLIWMMEARGWN